MGGRYAHLEQDFSQMGSAAGAVGNPLVNSKITFDGVGLRTGLEGKWLLGRSQVEIYGNGFLDVLFGEFSARYSQFDVAAPGTLEAASHWVDSRPLPILETEVGLKWTSCHDHWQLGVGYYTAFWFNTVDTADFIHAVQSTGNTSDFSHVGATISFTGLVAHAQYSF